MYSTLNIHELKGSAILSPCCVQLVEIAEGSLMDSENITSFKPSESPRSDMEFEGHYNRDSTKYVDIYNIPEAETVIRGTYRYKVWGGGGGVVSTIVDVAGNIEGFGARRMRRKEWK